MRGREDRSKIEEGRKERWEEGRIRGRRQGRIMLPLKQKI